LARSVVILKIAGGHRIDLAPWDALGLKLGSVEQETDDEAVEVHAGADH
jgi:hypothetical protein